MGRHLEVSFSDKSRYIGKAKSKIMKSQISLGNMVVTGEDDMQDM